MFPPQITFTNMVSVDEKLTYKPHPEDPEKYVLLCWDLYHMINFLMQLFNMFFFHSFNFQNNTDTGGHHLCQRSQSQQLPGGRYGQYHLC